ncbi:2OG-Fe(II) oxygenase [Alphaproteobacteria bacterium]|nr:2OG-Fe(II) oxygenase [Alphaproteobacteria bacterium]
MRELYQLWSSALTTKQIDEITKAALGQPAQDGTIFSAAESMKGIRTSSIRWISDQWIKDLLWDYIEQANDNAFNIDIHNDAEMQFTEYHAKQAGHYDWHHDVNWNGSTGSDRKLSVTVQLSDPSEYEGGAFEFDDVKTNADFASKGTILIFPSYLRHRVCPVTKGTRRSLVAWFGGPRWR